MLAGYLHFPAGWMCLYSGNQMEQMSYSVSFPQYTLPHHDFGYGFFPTAKTQNSMVGRNNLILQSSTCTCYPATGHRHTENALSCLIWSNIYICTQWGYANNTNRYLQTGAIKVQTRTLFSTVYRIYYKAETANSCSR